MKRYWEGISLKTEMCSWLYVKWEGFASHISYHSLTQSQWLSNLRNLRGTKGALLNISGFIHGIDLVDKDSSHKDSRWFWCKNGTPPISACRSFPAFPSFSIAPGRLIVYFLVLYIVVNPPKLWKFFWSSRQIQLDTHVIVLRFVSNPELLTIDTKVSGMQIWFTMWWKETELFSILVINSNSGKENWPLQSW